MYKFGYSGIWDDTILWFHSYLPSWLTGVEKIDVPEEELIRETGEQYVMDRLQEAGGKLVLLSARAQYVLWKAMRDEKGKLDELLEYSQSLPEEDAEQVQYWVAKKNESLNKKAETLFGVTEDALSKGVPPAKINDWLLIQMEPTAALPAIWTVVTVIGVSIIIASGVVIASKFIADVFNSKYETAAKMDAVKVLLEGGQAALIPDLFKQEKEKGFPWGWLIGIAAAFGVGIVTINYASEHSKEWFKPKPKEQE